MRLPVNQTAVFALLLAGSAQAQTANGPAADYPVTVGAAYTVEGTTFTPVDTLNYDAVGHALIGSEGGSAISGAHHTLPVPCYVEVTSLESGRTILVRLDRRGPMGAKNLVELSPGAAAQLGIAGKADAPVRVRRVNPPEVERSMLRSGGQAPARMDTPMGLVGVLKRKLDRQDGVAEAPPQQASAAPSAAPQVTAASPATPLTKAEPKPAQVAVKAPAKPAAEKGPGVMAAAKPKSDSPGVSVAVAGPASKPEPKPKATPAPKPDIAANVPPAAAKPGGSYVVQVGAFAKQPNADAVARKLGTAPQASGKLWRVRMGPFADKAAADAALAKARSAGYSDARIQRAS